MIKIIITEEERSLLDKSLLKDCVISLESVLNKLVKEKIGDREAMINLVFIDEDKMQKINSDFRGKNYVTDVLSFPYWEEYEDEGKSKIMLGDVFLAPNYIRLQAKENNTSYEYESAMLFTHGLLHLFGFDHNTDSEELEMNKYLDLILKELF